ncbi:MAG: hypothetical protein HUU50_10315 [Candidatus Brocadiae bacterium]|nr:hypothetical protein [Candidatus Brocadiia bacterium]
MNLFQQARHGQQQEQTFLDTTAGILYGGHLLTLNSASENTFVLNTFNANSWLGAYQTSKASEPGGYWAWITGEAFSYSNWRSGEPNNSGGGEDVAEMYNSTYSGQWNDLGATNGRSYIIEYGIIISVPEPATFAMAALILVAVALGKRNR